MLQIYLFQYIINYLWQYISVANTFILLYQIILLHIKTNETKNCEQKF